MMKIGDKVIFKEHKGIITEIDNKTYSITSYLLKTNDGFNMICFNENELIKLSNLKK